MVPYQRLSPEALRGVIEEFVTRDGTEFSDVAVKVEQVRRQLEQGTAVIVYDPNTRTCNVVPADPSRNRKGGGQRGERPDKEATATVPVQKASATPTQTRR